MNKSRKENGFTLIEIIIVISIIAILSSGILYLVSTFRYGDPFKSANLLNHTMEKVRIETMSKDEKQYLYIYNMNGITYFKISTNNDYSRAELNEGTGTKLGRGIEITYKKTDELEKKLRDTEHISLFFMKSSGAFGSDFEYIKFIGSSKEVILYCVKETGRHYIE
ncbi:prepilin-type N-terminal cleavage/methylation domain-containing protein [Clostridium sp. Marseille-P299]|uniref:prepilin-type N-terminal cleavage/methylation domain-containing protein n=1 Tax=Clostridium sp. Marseille-P299 TaxID=1805477 RepID=UPI000829BA00|nr:prepilin-type N-terminal cleavage/methylation domain-containing protein [Clostridium sp. Marseille-P299]